MLFDEKDFKVFNNACRFQLTWPYYESLYRFGKNDLFYYIEFEY